MDSDCTPRNYDGKRAVGDYDSDSVVRFGKHQMAELVILPVLSGTRIRVLWPGGLDIAGLVE